MTYPILSLCCCPPHHDDDLGSAAAHCAAATCLTAVDAFVFITFLVVGILGALSILSIGTISYGFISISASIFVLWVIRAIQCCKNNCV